MTVISKFDARQTISKDLLDQLTIASGVELDNILRAINSNVTYPLKLSATGLDRITSIGSIFVTNPETSKNRTIATILNTIPNFLGGTITAPVGGVGTITVSPGVNLAISMAANEFLKIGINMNSVGLIYLTAGLVGSSLVLATPPPGISDTFSVGYMVLRTDGSNLIQNTLASDIYQYDGGFTGDAGAAVNSLRIAAYYDAIVGSVLQLSTGQATHTSIAAAILDFVGLPVRILILPGTYTENVTLTAVTNNNVVIQGKGYGTVINGNFTLGSSYCSIESMRIQGNLSISGSANFVQSWVDNTTVFSDIGIGNDYRIIQG